MRFDLTGYTLFGIIVYKTIRKVVETWHSLSFTGYTYLTERIPEIWPPSAWILPRR